MRSAFRKGLALLLAVLTLASLSAAAAAGNYKYPENQYFTEGEGGTDGYAVNVSASYDYSGAAARRDALLRQGFDCYVYAKGDQYRVMCGKFRRDEYNAATHYLDYILSHTDRKDAYITNVDLPDWAYSDFWSVFATDPFNTGDQPYTSHEDPSGPFYDGNQGGTTRRVYTVQISAGTSFPGAQNHRDELIAQGFDAFVYKIGAVYRTMSGMFDNYVDAEARCNAIIRYTDEDDAYVTQVDIPTGARVDAPVTAPGTYYNAYVNLLNNDSWARSYLPGNDVKALTDASVTTLMDVYYVVDVDGNGVDELLVMRVKSSLYGAWALFSCDSKGSPYLIAWNNTFSIPTVSVCQEKGVLAFQGFDGSVSGCELQYVKNGKANGSTQCYKATSVYVRVDPVDVESKADGYYVELVGNYIGDLSRLTGKSGSVPSQPSVNSSPSGSYTRAGVEAGARAVAGQVNSHYSLISSEGVQLEIPPERDFLRNPYQMQVDAGDYAIYIMPKPQNGNGHLGTVPAYSLVTVVAETEYYYFFVTEDGKAGWNGKSFFCEP